MPEPKILTASEISSHTSRGDCWLVIHGKVYDVTRFLEDHPGGEAVLLQASDSGNATDAFEEVGHSSSATAMMGSYEIGVLEGYTSSGAASGGVSDEPGRARSKVDQGSYSFFDYLLPLLILALASAAWYYLTFMSKENSA